MKTILTLLFLSPIAYAETYICSFNYKEPNYPTETEIHKFTRSSNTNTGTYFLHEINYMKLENLSIYNEVFKDDSYLILGQRNHVVKIDRRRLKATYVSIWVDNETEVSKGICTVDKLENKE
tara:strand:+ start:327 stop:692 length:366 start_codon:yes stop_codon:yes gene_type:complete